MKKKLIPLLAAVTLTIVVLLATGCAAAPTVVRNPPADPQTAYNRLSSGWNANLVPSTLAYTGNRHCY